MTANKKAKPDKIDTDTSESGTTKRGYRSTNFDTPNAIASQRGTKSRQVQGKKLSKKNDLIEKLVPMDDQDDSDHERIVFIR